MRPVSKKQDVIDIPLSKIDIPLSKEEDAMLEKMKVRMAQQFESNTNSWSYEAQNSAATAAAAYAAIVTEQRARAILRAKTPARGVRKP